MEAQSPDFESIKQISHYGVDYWSARDLVPLLGYDKWQNYIEQRLSCTFIRYNPDAPNFNIGDVINQIIVLIYGEE